MPAYTRNRLLSSLSPECRDLLLARCTEVSLPIRTWLYRPEEAPKHAFFMTSGMASLVAPMEDGGSAEVGIVGSEGVVGALHLLGPTRVSTESFIQLEGSALRIAFADLREAYRASEETRDRLLEFVQEQTVSTSQIAGCNRLHDAEERLARWLLMAQDRVQAEVLNFTQEFLAMMLGSRRTTVTLIAGALQKAGLIEYQRGRVKILDRPSLEAAACPCYGILRKAHAELYTIPLPASAPPPHNPKAAGRSSGFQQA